MSQAYKDSGVDIDAAANLVEQIKPHIARTKRSGVMSGIGGFGALFDLKNTGYKDPLLVSGTDGVGTKIKVAIDLGIHNTIGIDAVAMCVNDIVVQGAEPLFFLDYFATGKLENHVAEQVIAGIAEGCAQAGCALIGGETAEMPGLYAQGDYDIAGFSVGAVERDQVVTGNTIQDGDIVLGLASNGIHSNGFSLVRRLIETTQGCGYDKPESFTDGKTMGEFILTPTRIYVRSILSALKQSEEKGEPLIRGMAHITGGGLLENIPRVLPDGLTARIDASSWELPEIFYFLAKAGNLTAHDLGSAFNSGIGMAVICRPADVASLQKVLTDSGETVFQIGRIEKSDDQKERVIIDNTQKAWPVS